ncbi:MAG: hypothetical protein JW706_06135 [Opitutales bacterium]|nr:hypothetical protein [Opitutales bacterium]
MESVSKSRALTRILDAGIAFAVWLLLCVVLRGFVPMDGGPMVKSVVAAYTAFPIACVFWMATQMFRVTIEDQMQPRRVRVDQS